MSATEKYQEKDAVLYSNSVWGRCYNQARPLQVLQYMRQDTNNEIPWSRICFRIALVLFANFWKVWIGPPGNWTADLIKLNHQTISKTTCSPTDPMKLTQSGEPHSFVATMQLDKAEQMFMFVGIPLQGKPKLWGWVLRLGPQRANTPKSNIF